MTSTEPTETTTPDREEYDTEVFGTGEECGVCHFPTGRGEICGNVVYANGPKGRLPLYCGQEGQSHWQKENGTEGNPRHQSSLAGYPRKTLGMTKEDCAALAEAEAARRGIVRRTKSDTGSTAAAEVSPAPAAAPVGPVAPVDLSDALPDSPVEALNELAQLIVGRVVAARKEMETVRNAAEDRAAEIERENVARVEELDAQRAELEAEQEAAREITARAESEIQSANEARLRAEGELDGARRRIAELEAALTAADQRRIIEVEEVRRVEREEFRLAMREFATTVRGETSAREAVRGDEDRPVGEDAVQTMAQRVTRNEIARRGELWLIGNVEAPRPAARVLDHMLAEGRIRVGQGDPERVTLAYERPRR